MKACLLRFEDATENRRLLWSNLFYIQILKSVSHIFAEESVLKVSSHPIPTEHAQENKIQKVSGHTRILSTLLQKQILTKSFYFQLWRMSAFSFRDDDWGRLGVFLTLPSLFSYSQAPVTSITAVHSVHSATLTFSSITCPKSSIV